MMMPMYAWFRGLAVVLVIAMAVLPTAADSCFLRCHAASHPGDQDHAARQPSCHQTADSSHHWRTDNLPCPHDSDQAELLPDAVGHASRGLRFLSPSFTLVIVVGAGHPGGRGVLSLSPDASPGSNPASL